MKTVFSYTGGIGFQELIVLLVSIAVCIAIFLALRALVLWYWKIDRIVNNQQEQIRLLQEVIHTLEKTFRKEVV